MANYLYNEDNIDEFVDAAAEYKIILAGDSTVGKTTLFKKITSGQFIEKSILTIGRDKRKFDLEIEVEENGKKVQKKVSIILEDTAGQERYQALTKTYFKGAHAILLLYNINKKKTFDNLEHWLQLIRENANPGGTNEGYLIFLMGTQFDKVAEDSPKKREVEESDAIKFCTQKGLIWKGECSSKDFSEEKYKQIFSEFAEELWKKFKSNIKERLTVSTLQKKKIKKKKKCCGKK